MTIATANYEIKERSATEVVLQITVAAETIQQELHALYQQYRQRTQIPGFRKGHVPRNLLDLHFGRDRFLEEIQEELQSKHLANALSQLNLSPVTRPTIKTVSFQEGKPFVFEVRFAVFPQFDLPQYRGIELAVDPPLPVTQDDVASALEEIRHQLATLVSKQGDVVNPGDFVRVKQGRREWDIPAQAENTIGAKLIGHRLGETIPIELDEPEGNPRQTTLSIVGLKEVRLPNIDDELAKDAGYKTLAALKADVEKKLAAARRLQRERETKGALLDRLAERATIPLPEGLLNELVEQEVAQLKQRISRLRPTCSFEDYLKQCEKTEEGVRADCRAAISRRLRHELFLAKIAKAEGITVAESELERLATEEAKKDGENPLRFIARLKAEDRWEDYRTHALNARVLDLLYETAKLS